MLRLLLALAPLVVPCLCQWGLSVGAVNPVLPGAPLDLAVVRSSNDTPIPPIYPIGQGGGSFAKPAGRLFDIDGKISYWAGANAWWLGHLSNTEDIDIAMQEIADTQYKVMRVWAFGEVDDSNFPAADATDPHRVWFQYFNETGSYINYGADGLQQLDYMVSSAERHGVKLVMVLVNFWSDWGGVTRYAVNFDIKAYQDWYDSKLCQAVYLRWVRTLVSRYKDSPAIFSWELCNEPRCEGCSTDVITNWAGNMSAFIKAIDPNHMVALGDEGWFSWKNGHYTDRDPSGVSDIPAPQSVGYAGWTGIDFVANLNVTGLDYAVFHLYPSTWGYNDTWGNLWIQQHDDAAAKAGVPLVLEEYGCNQPNNHTYPEAMWQASMLKSGIAGDQVWQFGPSNTSVDPGAWGDPNSIYYNESEYGLLAKGHAQNMLDKRVWRLPRWRRRQ